MKSDHTALKAAFAAMLVFALNVPCHAESTLTERSFVDLSDTSDASSDNEAEAERGVLPSNLAPLNCFRGANPSGRSTAITLSVQIGRYGIFNPDTDSFDMVSLRSYNGCPLGPTISIKPGATLNLTLKNNLTVNDPPDFCPSTFPLGTPHCFNQTNLHTHGLHVSPSGTSDNVLITVLPGAMQAYTYDIPSTHPSGTFLYHAHHHGSTAIQVSSGMAGVLIVRGSRPARAGVADGTADIDTILHRNPPDGASDREADGRQNRDRHLGHQVPLREHVMLFEQIEYACFSNSTSTVPLADPTTFKWICPKGSGPGEIRGYTNQLTFLPDPRPGHAGQMNSSWVISGRYTQINGVVQPVFPSAHTLVPAGDIRRFRMVHEGNRDTINFKIVRANLSALGLAEPPSMTAAQVDDAMRAATAALAKARTQATQTTTLDSLCSGETVKQLELAEDGITLSAMVEKDVNTMNPGYRSDVLVAFPSPGLYCILDEAADASATINFRPNASKVKDRRLLSFARVGPGVNIPNTTVGSHSKYWQYIRDQLVAANPTLPEPAKSDLASLTLKAFAPTIPVDGAIDKTVPAQFDVPGPPLAPPQFVINGQVYNPTVINYTGTLGHIDEWVVSSTVLGGSHVFHIHTNPFRIMDIRNAAGHSVFSSAGGCTPEEAATGDLEYCNLQGVVRDTLNVKAGYTLVMRTIYQDFTGEFVMHCHISDHEDHGMMENVSIVSPTTAFLQRMSTPVRPLSDRATRWFDRLTGKQPDATQSLLAAGICSARYVAGP